MWNVMNMSYSSIGQRTGTRRKTPYNGLDTGIGKWRIWQYENRKSGDAGIKYDPAQVRIHEAYTVAIRDLGVHGEGIGSVDGFTVFVPGALPGETVTVKITLLKNLMLWENCFS